MAGESDDLDKLFESVADGEELTKLGSALDELAAVDQMLADVVDLKFFSGFSIPEIAATR